MNDNTTMILISLICVGVIIGIFYFIITSPKLSEYINTSLREKDTQNKNDTTQKEILDVLYKIKFWITLIGIYYLMKILINVFKFTVAALAGYELMTLLNEIL